MKTQHTRFTKFWAASQNLNRSKHSSHGVNTGKICLKYSLEIESNIVF